MIKFEKAEIVGWEHAIRGMRNPMNSWERSDSDYCSEIDRCTNCPAFNFEREFCGYTEYANTINRYGRSYILGPNDHKLASNLANSGSVHAKYRRMIVVYVDITAPLYWWKEFDTYKVGTVANSCSTMHKIADEEFTLEDFSHEHLIDSQLEESESGEVKLLNMQALGMLQITIGVLNAARYNYLKTKDKKYWWQLIQLLPTSYNQKRTVMLNYEVLAGLYPMRKDHKLDEWYCFCDWVRGLPYSELITGEEKENV